MSKNKTPITAGELIARLSAEPEFPALRARQGQDLTERSADVTREEQPLLDELHAAGYTVPSVWNLMTRYANKYPEAIPILLKHLPRPYRPPVRESIAQALGVPQARFAWPILMDLYKKEQERQAKSGMAAALSAIADKEVFEDVLNIVRDSKLGPSRMHFLRKLTRTRDSRGLATLLELQSDPDLTKEIQYLLKRRKPKKQ